MMVKSKSANITVSFSWIFMIIVGTFFLLVAYNIVGNYMENEEAKYNYEVKKTVRNIFNNVGRTAGIEENSLEPIKYIFRNKDVEIICEENIPILSIDGNLDTTNDFLKSYPTFMTYISQGKVDETYLAVESFRLPFKVTNMLAIVSQKNMIVFDEESLITEKFLYKFRKGSYSDLNYVVRNFQDGDLSNFNYEIKDKNLNSIIFVSDENRSISGFDIANLNELSYHIKIKEDNNQGHSGEIIYFDKTGKSTSFNYVDYDNSLGLITMSLFSRPEVFECSYNTILSSTLSIYDYYIKKTQYLINESKNEWICSKSIGSKELQEINYRLLLEKLNNIENKIESESFNNKEDLYSLLYSLEQIQETLESFNCIYVY